MDPAIEALLSQYADTPEDNRRLADQIARMKAAGGAMQQPAAEVPVTSEALPPPKMTGGGTPVVNKGIQGTPGKDASPSGSMDKYLQDSINARSDFGGVTPGTKPSVPETPAQEEYVPHKLSAVNGYQNGPGASFSQRIQNTGDNIRKMMPEKTPAPTAASLAARQGTGSTPSDLWRLLVERAKNPRF